MFVLHRQGYLMCWRLMAKNQDYATDPEAVGGAKIKAISGLIAGVVISDQVTHSWLACDNSS